MSLVMQFHNRSKAFHADIARKAAMLCPAQDRSYSIPNTPFGVKKVEPPRPPTPPNIEPEYWGQMWFFDLIFGKPRTDGVSIKVEDVLSATASEFGISKLDIISQRRSANVVLPRQVAMYLAKVVTGRSLPEIGRRIGGRDHTTVLHGIRKIEARVTLDTNLATRVERIKASL